MKPLLFFFLFLTITFSLYADENNSSMVFRYGFFINDKVKGIENLDIVDKIINLKEGDEFRITFQPVKNSFVYFFLTDSQNTFYVLHPDNEKSFDKKDYNKSKEINIPNEGWFMVDAAKGIEEFEIIVLNQRLLDFEKLLFEYIKVSEKNKDIKKINNLKEEIKDFIITLKKKNSGFTVAAEKPISIGGTSRGVEKPKLYLSEIDTEKFYAKTIKIQH